MLCKLKNALKDERGISTPEALVIGSLAALMGYFVWNTIRPYTNSAAGTLGGKINNAVGSNNPSW